MDANGDTTVEDKLLSLRNNGKAAMKNKNFDQAIYIYERAVGLLSTLPDGEWKDMKMIFNSNLAEAYLKTNKFAKAHEFAEKSLKNKGDDVLFLKSLIRCGKALVGLERYPDALHQYKRALQHIRCGKGSVHWEGNTSEDLLQRSFKCVLKCSLGAQHHETKELWKIIPTFKKWIHVGYDLLKSNNWDVSRIPLTAVQQDLPHSTSDIRFDLSLLNNMHKLKYHEWAVAFLIELVIRGTNLKGLTNEDGNHLHVFTTILLRSKRDFLDSRLEDLLKKEMDWNEVDGNGNTIFHTICVDKSAADDRKLKYCQFIANNFTTLDVNTPHPKDGKCPIDLLSEKDGKTRKFLKSRIIKMSRDAKAVACKMKMCEQFTKYSNSLELLKNQKFEEAFDLLARLMDNKHMKKTHPDTVNELPTHIAHAITDCDELPQVPRKLLKIHPKYFKVILQHLLEVKKYKPMIQLFKRFTSANGGSSNIKDFAKGIHLEETIGEISNRNEDDVFPLFIVLSECGAKFEKDGESIIDLAISKNWFRILMYLLQRKEINLRYLVRSEGETPVHSILTIALECDNLDILKVVLKRFSEDKTLEEINPNQTNKDGESIAHVVCQKQCSEAVLEAMKCMIDYDVDFNLQDPFGKVSRDYLDWDDERRKLLPDTIDTTKDLKKQTSAAEKSPERDKPPNRRADYKKKTKNPEMNTTKHVPGISKSVEELRKIAEKLISDIKEPDLVSKRIPQPEEEGFASSQNTETAKPSETAEEDDISDIEQTIKSFDESEWDIKLLDRAKRCCLSKDTPRSTKKKILRVLLSLAGGQKLNTKKLKHKDSDSIELYRTKIGKAERIIWETEKLPDDPNKKIIMIWDIVLDHDKQRSSIDWIVMKSKSLIQSKKLRKGTALKRNENEAGPSKESLEDENLGKESDVICNIPKCFGLNSRFAYSMLKKGSSELDFKFELGDEENEILNLNDDAAILLLGRSGTGKTTCCLYRMVDHFLNYWTKAENNKEDGEGEGEKEIIGPDFHQLFITKNAVLCQEAENHFWRLCGSYEECKDHFKVDRSTPPVRLHDIPRRRFPLFLTFRQLLLLLDASLNMTSDGQIMPFFFKRDENYHLCEEIAGWSYTGEHVSLIEDLNEETDEDDEDADDRNSVEDPKNTHSDTRSGKSKLRHKNKAQKRKEITFELFQKDIWPHLGKKIEKKKYHPSLVWSEIVSFIKGSFEALKYKKGYMSMEDYRDLGKKKAPFFQGNRDDIYQLFVEYKDYKQQHMWWFDDMDVLKHIYGRLSTAELPCEFHEIFIDETQDFSESEMWLLMQICSDPNKMFFTGDEAQSIIEGISFRFKDLKSLFKYAHDSLKKQGHNLNIRVPKEPYCLLHNYRSHDGILALAASVLDILHRFFPQTFDKGKERERGLLSGPKPVILDVDNLSDLAYLLRGNERSTSYIEFGAHQAIIVANDEARDNMPDDLRQALVLTIYQSKGLEFDDVLLYNFFTDSQASKEWNIVTSYLQELSRNENEPDTVNLEDRHKVIATELKQLYTAITRTKGNLWIYDSDYTKRKPMFDYFRKRDLVRYMSIEDQDQRHLFTKPSTPIEWLVQGEKLMKRQLFREARNCFRNAKNNDKAKLAEAFEIAQSIQKSEREEVKYLHAATLFLETNCERRYTKEAKICLRKAKEHLLLAKLCEKTGKFVRAGALYKKLDMFREYGCCCEKAGNLAKAVEVYSKNKLYTEAREALQKMPTVDLPKTDHFNIDYLISREALAYLDKGQADKVMGLLDGVQDMERIVVTLDKKGYGKMAAEILKKEEKIEDAAEMYLKHGLPEKAIGVVKKFHDKNLIYKCYLTDARVRLKQPELCDSDKTKIRGNLENAVRFFQSKSINDKDKAGETYLLLYSLSSKPRLLEQAFGAFLHSNPDKNYAGMLSCMTRMMQNADLKDTKTCDKVIRGMSNFFFVLKSILQNFSDTSETTAKNIMTFYGFHGEPGKKMLTCYPLMGKPAVEILLHVGGNDISVSEVNKPMSYATIATFSYLLKSGENWNGEIRKYLRQQYERGGTPIVDRQAMTNASMDRLLLTLCNLDLDICVNEGRKDLLQLWKNNKDISDSECLKCSEGHDSFELYLQKHFHDEIISSPSRLIWDALQLHSCQSNLQDTLSSFVTNKKGIIIRYITFHTRQMLEEKGEVNCCTGIFNSSLFLSHIFRCGEMEFQNHAIEFKEKIFQIIQKRTKGNKKEIRRESDRLGLLCSTNKGRQYLECVTDRLSESIHFFYRKKDPMESIIKFTKFTKLLCRKSVLDYLQSHLELQLCLEFYILVALMIRAKETGSVILIPKYYNSTVHFFDAIFSRTNCTALDIISECNTIGHEKAKLLEERVVSLVKFMHDLINSNYKKVFHRDDNTTDRFLLFGLVLLCNADEKHLTLYASLLPVLCKLSEGLSKDCRLNCLLTKIQKCSNQLEVGKVLSDLLGIMQSKLLIYKWNGKMDLQEKLQLETILSLTKYPSHLTDVVKEAAQEPDEDIDEDISELAIPAETIIVEENYNELIDQANIKIVIKYQRRLKLKLRLKRRNKTILQKIYDMQIEEERRQRLKALFLASEDKNGKCGICKTPFLEVNKDTEIWSDFILKASSYDEEHKQPQILHEQDHRHMKRKEQYGRFEERFKMDIFPYYDEVNEFIMNFRLNEDVSYFEDISCKLNSLQSTWKKLRADIADVIENGTWEEDMSKCSENVKRLRECYADVREFVFRQAREIKEQKRRRNSPANCKETRAKHEKEDEENDDEEGFQEVVYKHKSRRTKKRI